MFCFILAQVYCHFMQHVNDSCFLSLFFFFLFFWFFLNHHALDTHPNLAVLPTVPIKPLFVCFIIVVHESFTLSCLCFSIDNQTQTQNQYWTHLIDWPNFTVRITISIKKARKSVHFPSLSHKGPVWQSSLVDICINIIKARTCFDRLKQLSLHWSRFIHVRMIRAVCLSENSSHFKVRSIYLTFFLCTAPCFVPL